MGKQGAIQLQCTKNAVWEFGRLFNAYHNRYEMVGMMEAEPPEPSGGKELPTQILLRLKGLMAFIETRKSELTATKRRTTHKKEYTRKSNK